MLTIGGGVLMMVAVGLLVWRRLEEGKLSAVTGTETSTVQELADLAQSADKGLRGDGGAGQTGLPKYAEVKGVVRSEKPLTSHLGKEECIYYRFEVTREYDVEEWDSQEKLNVTKRRSETVSQGERWAPFGLEDATGRIPVDPSGAEVDAVKVVDRFERDFDTAMGIAIGEFSINLGREGETFGYHYGEKVLQVDQPVYVLGEASTSSGELRIQRPGGGKRFFISHRSEEALVNATRNTIRLLTAGMIAFGLAGLALVIVGLLGVI